MTMNNPFFEVLDENMKEIIESNGDILISRDPLQNQDKQNEQILDMIEDGIDALFLNPVDWKRVSYALKECEKRNIPVFVIDTEVYNEENIVSTILSDNYEAGVQCAKDMMNKLGKANIVILYEENINSTADRVRGFLDTIKNQDTFTVIEKVTNVSDLEAAMEEMKKIINKNNDCDVIFCGNDPTALGAIAAMQKMNRNGSAYIYGIDGSPDAKVMIKAGYMEATSAQSPIKIGVVAVETAYKYMNGQKVEKRIKIPVNLITRQNLKDYSISGWQ